MESKIHQISKSAYAVIGPEGATNFGIVKATDGSAVLVDADIRRIDEVEEALRLTGCAKVGYLVNTHEHFDHTSANYFFEQRGVPIVASAGCVRAMREEGEPDFARILRPVSELYERFPGLRLTLPDVVFPDSTTLTSSWFRDTGRQSKENRRDEPISKECTTISRIFTVTCWK